MDSETPEYDLYQVVLEFVVESLLSPRDWYGMAHGSAMMHWELSQSGVRFLEQVAIPVVQHLEKRTRPPAKRQQEQQAKREAYH